MENTDLRQICELADDEEHKKRAAYFGELIEIQKSKEHFLRTGEILPNVRKKVADSWLRSQKYLAPTAINATQLEGAELERLLEQNSLLISLSSSVVESICGTLYDNEYYFMYVSDKNGYLLYINKAYDENNSPIKGLKVGIRSLEEDTGTNSVAMALIHERDMIIHGPEHFLSKYANLTCTTALIHDSAGEIIGSVSITFSLIKYNHFIPDISSVAAKLIEEQFAKYRFSEIMESIAFNASESVLIIDSYFNVIYANEKMLSLLNYSNEDLASLNVKEMFSDFDFNEAMSAKGVQSARESLLYWKDRQFRMNIHTYSIYKDLSLDCMVMFCQEISSLIYMSRKFTGKYNYYTFENIITRDPGMRDLIAQCRRIADLDVPVLIHGQSGVGKELFAQSIHSASRRASKPFMTVNCAALPLSLIESELFGYEKGAFTGAHANGKLGKFELANDGTIFLDEIGELPLDVQAKLLRVLDNYKVSRIGSSKEISLNVRLLSATNRNLQEEVATKNFREDLFYRLNVLNILVPPLNDRKGDIELLAEHFLRELNAKNPPAEKKRFAPKTLEALARHKWNGNVRELQNAITRAYYLSKTSQVQPELLPVSEFVPPRPVSAMQSKEDKERAMIENALATCQGNVPKASELCGIPVSTLYRKISKYNIYLREFMTGRT